MKIVDPHLHLFDLNQGQYFWLKPQNPPFWLDKSIIQRNFTEQDLTLTSPMQLAGFVHIEAGFNNQKPHEEIDWLEKHCTLPFKSVAFADLTSLEFAQNIKRLTQRTSVSGIRHILDEQADDILSAKLTAKHFALLAENGLSFDLQMPVDNTQAVTKLIVLAKQHPELKIIINHAGWPPDNSNRGLYNQWFESIQKLASLPNIGIKLSAWEMCNRKWEIPWLIQVLQDCLDVFGELRVMLASNFPLCLFSKSYQELWQVYNQLVDILDIDRLRHITYTNAINWYGLKVIT
ncbi:amidohydrolase family protein [Paraglaciecola aquimarina]|uniref:Amidohydrolase family protein n=1 Tax=Paraglaciecola algarum TaxID=3050085 RepID=A0ABS9DA17_9ALTE|nr:amidohydrolase family protein [Paraglaciecola sp. G1-23]